MTAIWLLSTKGRPKAAQETIDACMDAGMTSLGVVYCDETPYPKLKLPRNWRMHYEPEWRSLQGSMSWCFESYSTATQYGWLADDTRPRTRGWDKQLEEAAGDWNLAYAADLWFSENPGEIEQLERGNNLSSGLCWGGELVRAVGWWALPGVRQAGIDMAWLDLVRPLNLHRYMPEIVVEHLNWRTKKRAWDETDDWERGGVSYIEQDLVIKRGWAASVNYRNTLRLLADMTESDADVWPAVRLSYADAALIRGEIPAARLDRILGGELDTDIDRIDAYQRPAGLDRPLRSVGATTDISGLGAGHL